MLHGDPSYTGPGSYLRANTLTTMELEDRTIEQLPDRCQNCGATLTDAEKATALTEGPPSGLVLCTTCASEVVPVEENEAAEPDA
jgi:hypothetical protein